MVPKTPILGFALDGGLGRGARAHDDRDGDLVLLQRGGGQLAAPLDVLGLSHAGSQLILNLHTV